MRTRIHRFWLPWAVIASLASGCGSSSEVVSGHLPAPAGDLPPLAERPSLDAQISPAIAQTRLAGCDFLEPAYCHFPWPNDYFTKADAATDTGRQIDLNVLGMPKNIAGLPIRPTEWNRNDGFSPGQLIVTYVDQLDLQASGIGTVTDIEASLRSDAPIVVIDAETGERHPIWAEIDASHTAQTPCETPDSLASTLALLADQFGLGDGLAQLTPITEGLEGGCSLTLGPILAALGSGLDATLLPNNALKIDPPALLIRPARNFSDGHRYIVAMRRLKTADGTPIQAPPAFRVYRDRHPSDIDEVNARRTHMETLFTRLTRYGIDRDDLYMAWDFTVASTRNTAGRLLSMRDTALDQLGDAAPVFTIDTITDFDQGESIRRVEGRLTVPNFLTVPDGLCDNLIPPLSSALDYCTGLDTLTGALGSAQAIPGLGDILKTVVSLGELVQDMGQLPLSRLVYASDDQTPVINPASPTQQFGFQCEIPRTAVGSLTDPDTWLRPATPTLYGHGLLGSKSEVGGGSTRRLREQNFMHCAIDWIGMSTRDVPSVITFLLDMSLFATLPDRAQQGMVNWHYLTRLLSHPQGFAASSAFQTADGRSLFDPREVFYDGNSQGGIMGGVVMATSTEIKRGSLGVPGANYSTLLRRSVDFDGYGGVLYTAYPNSFDQSFVLSLIQMLWDRGESNGYINHLRRPQAFAALGHPTPDHEVMLNVAFGDHQVADLTAEVMTRSFDGTIHMPATEPGRSSNVNPHALMRPAQNGQSESVTVFWDIGPLNPDNPDNPGTATPPAFNSPPFDGRDPHSDPRAEIAGGIQRQAFLREHRYQDVCGGRPCFARGYVPATIASGQDGNRAPVINALQGTTASPGSQVALNAITADPEQQTLRYAWQVQDGAECVVAIDAPDSPATSLTLAPACARDTLTLRVTVTDAQGASSSATTNITLR